MNKISLESQAYGIVCAFTAWQNEKGENPFSVSPIDLHAAWKPADVEERELVTHYGMAVRDALLKEEVLLSECNYYMYTNQLNSRCIRITLGSLQDTIDSYDPFEFQDSLFLELYICPRFTKSSSPWTQTERLYKSIGNGEYEFNSQILKKLTGLDMSDNSIAAFDKIIKPLKMHAGEKLCDLYPDRKELFAPLMKVMRKELKEQLSDTFRIWELIGNLFGNSTIYSISMNEKNSSAELCGYIYSECSSHADCLLKWPTKLESISYLKNSKGTSAATLVLKFNDGWKAEVRVVYPSTLVSPSSIGFTFSISEFPDYVYKSEVSYKDYL